MTHAEKLAKRALVNKCPKELLDNVRLRVAVLKVMTELVQEAMQAQREADANIAWECVAMMHRTDYDNIGDYAREVKRAILNAEVKI